MPEEVATATSNYRNEEDVIGSFIDACCVTGADDRGRPLIAGATPLYESYRQWTTTGGEAPMSQRKFGSELGSRGFESVRNQYSGLKEWSGIGIRSSE